MIAASMTTLLPILFLASFWLWETFAPARPFADHRLKHAGNNLALALGNNLLIGVLFGTATVLVAEWTETRHAGLTGLLGWSGFWRVVLVIVLLDAAMYVWHRLNHEIPFLWRFHRMHHTDTRMDVTTATRFHLGEHLGARLNRLWLIPLIGASAWEVVLYDLCLLAVTQWHHANVSVGRWDAPLRSILVTPGMHKVHHSEIRDETNSNYSAVFSWWDRIGRSFRFRDDLGAIRFGLPEFPERRWQGIWGMLTTPFVDHPPPESDGEKG
ncbi:Fatty acid hydroxylase superfamily protein [Planctomycetes bacterium Pan216]|uniref:Fatty acid hydroxylase superfamily protein n=1 Tax=Kolteria novifilia TaxID=2527975 RepID=A0A518AWW3_9BACT|nr:Fatty acid hydroxylase superfamily protein [Planctomycetes bacterium Pan216]